MAKTEKIEKIEKTKKTKKPAKKGNNNKIDKKSHINNEIIQSQGKFKQAKVAAIRKLVGKLKHPEKNPKQNRAAKTERYQNVLNQLKHMSPKRLGLLSLLYYKSGKNYLADQNSTVEQLAVGYFSEFKGLSAILDKIRNKVKLNETSNWRKSVRKLFKKKDSSKKKETVEKTSSFAESESTDTNAETKPKNKKVKQKAEPNGKSAKTAAKTQNKTIDSNESDDVTSTKSDESSESEEEIENESIKEKSASAPAPTTVDDFFITADGSNYLSTAVVSRNQEEDSDGGSNNRTQRGGFEKKSKESSFFHKSDKKPVKLAVNRFEGTKRKWSADEGEQVHVEKQPKVDPELHPSWQAKQKLKPTITEFKGKKITFD